MRVYKIGDNKLIEKIEEDYSGEVKDTWEGVAGYYSEDAINKLLIGGTIKNYLKQALEIEKSKEEITSLNGDIDYLQNKQRETSEIIKEKEALIKKEYETKKEIKRRVVEIVDKIGQELS